MNTKRYAPQIFLAVALLILGITIGCKPKDPDTFDQVDRIGVPGVNTALISTASKDPYNQGDPSDDVPNFRAQIVSNITALRAAVTPFLPPENFGTTPDALADIVCPDVVTIDFASTVAFPNGRGLDEDVMDVIVGLVLNRDLVGGGGGVADAIGANDVSNSGTFPYLAAPH